MTQSSKAPLIITVLQTLKSEGIIKASVDFSQAMHIIGECISMGNQLKRPIPGANVIISEVKV